MRSVINTLLLMAAHANQQDYMANGWLEPKLRDGPIDRRQATLRQSVHRARVDWDNNRAL